MALFTKAEVTSAYLKMGLMGFAGSGKTFTAAETAIGLILHMRKLGLPQGDRPLYALDTETGTDWIKPKVDAAGIDMFTAKTRAFSDLLDAVPEAERNASLLLVDSVTHFWTELGAAYMKKKNRTRLQFEDWAVLKGEWRKFTDLFVNSNLHVIICGRAGYEYDYFTDDAGRKQLEKTDIKMKAEGEMGYEPSLLVLMERETDMGTMKVGHVATVLKDRATMLDGKKFTDPTFETFLPHVRLLNLGGRQLGVDTTRNSEHTITADVRDNSRVQRKIVLDEIESLLVLHYPGLKAEEKRKKVELLRTHFAASWTELEEVTPLFDLRAGYDSLHRDLEGKPSRYAPAVESPAAPPRTASLSEELNDALPEGLGKADAPAAPAADPLDIPEALRRKPALKVVPVEEPKPSLKQRLLADIPRLGTPTDCLNWGLTMSAIMGDQLSHVDQGEVSLALLHRQKQVSNGAAHA